MSIMAFKEKGTVLSSSRLWLISLLICIFVSQVAFSQTGHSVRGILRYENTARTALVGVPVHLYAYPGFVVARDTTDA